ncbi:unnamed protein product [Boreogadus saida]
MFNCQAKEKRNSQGFTELAKDLSSCQHALQPQLTQRPPTADPLAQTTKLCDPHLTQGGRRRQCESAGLGRPPSSSSSSTRMDIEATTINMVRWRSVVPDHGGPEQGSDVVQDQPD